MSAPETPVAPENPVVSENKAAKLRLTVGGAVNARTGVYIVRPSDDELLALLERGEYCNVLCSRQMGKTSLIKRTRARLIEKGYATAEVEVAGVLGSPKDADEWYQGLLDEIARQLRLTVNVSEWWQTTSAVTANQKLIRFFRDEIIAKRGAAKPIIIFLDEIDSTLKLGYTDDFFVAIRAIYNDRASDPVYEKIAFCLVGVASPNELIKEKHTTPYNIGKTIELRDFDAHGDLTPLVQIVGTRAALNTILCFTGGHPYLTMLLCEKYSREECHSVDDVSALVEQQFASLDEALRDMHFSYIQGFIAERVEDALTTLKLYREIWNGQPVRDQVTPAHIALKLAGLVKRETQGRLIIRNEIYHRLFTDEWATKLAEDGTQRREEVAGLRAFAEVNERILREALDDYRLALGAYMSLKTNPAYTGNADDLWAQFFERRAALAEWAEKRDTAMLWRIQALAAAPANYRVSAVNQFSDPDYPKLCRTMRHDAAIWAVAFSPDGRSLLTGAADGTARLWDVQTGQSLAPPLRHSDGVTAVAFSPDGRMLLTGSYDCTACLWDAQTGQPLAPRLLHQASVRDVAFSPDGHALLTGAADGTARLWDTQTGQLLTLPLHHGALVWAVAFSPDGRSLLTGAADGTARLWDVQTGQSLAPPLRHSDGVTAVAFSPDGRMLLTGSYDCTACLWDAQTGQPLAPRLLHQASVRDVAFSPDGHALLTGAADGTARLWDTQTGQLRGLPLRHLAVVNAVAFSPDGHALLTGAADGTARLWDAANSKPLTPPLFYGALVCAAAFSSDGKILLTGADDGTARLWDVQSGQLLIPPLRHTECVVTVAFSPDGQQLLTGSDDGTAQLWDRLTGKPLGVPMRHEAPVRIVTFSPNGRILLTGGLDETAQLWDTQKERPLRSILWHKAWILTAAFSPDGQLAITGGADKTVQLWHAQSGQPFGTSLKHESPVCAVSFSPDGLTILTSTLRGTTRLWNVQSHEPIGTPIKFTDSALAIAFSPDGKLALVANRWWVHTMRVNEGGLSPIATRLLPSACVSRGVPFHYLSTTGDSVQIGVLNADDAIQLVTLKFDYATEEPLVGDPQQLLAEWQTKLGLQINAAGEIVPLH